MRIWLRRRAIGAGILLLLVAAIVLFAIFAAGFVFFSIGSASCFFVGIGLLDALRALGERMEAAR